MSRALASGGVRVVPAPLALGGLWPHPSVCLHFTGPALRTPVSVTSGPPVLQDASSLVTFVDPSPRRVLFRVLGLKAWTSLSDTVANGGPELGPRRQAVASALSPLLCACQLGGNTGPAAEPGPAGLPVLTPALPRPCGPSAGSTPWAW